MSIFDETDDAALISRYNNLIVRYVDLAKELAPRLEKFGKYRIELQEITSEFIKRNIKIEDSKELFDIISEEINKRQEQ